LDSHLLDFLLKIKIEGRLLFGVVVDGDNANTVWAPSDLA
jgi:hypothetical protein